MRHPRDYNTVPRHLFWLFHLIWLFPWSAYLPGLARLRYRGPERAGRTRLLLLCLAGVVMFFFTLSTTQEYYSMPVYPAVAMLLGCVLAANEGWLKRASYALAGVMTLGFLACAGLLGRVWNTPAPGDIERSLTQHPELYTLSLGHMGDLTLESFAYLKLPLAVAAAALLLGAAAAAWYRTRHTWIGLAAAMVLFFQAARLAMVEFDPYLSSYELAMAYKQAPSGRLVVDNQYYAFSSVPFYAGAQALLLLRGRVNNLEYGSYAPGAPRVFLSDEEFPALWNSGPRMYLLVERTELTRMIELAGPAGLHLVKRSGGKYLYTNLAP
jgi:4-amino-4-deoxy-L-arabinose transferase-like glycosyltransferase